MRPESKAVLYKEFAERSCLVYSAKLFDPALMPLATDLAFLPKLVLVFLIVSVYNEYPCLMYCTVWLFDLVDVFYAKLIPMYLP